MPTDFQRLLPSGRAIPKTLYGYNVIDPIGEGAGSTIFLVADPKTNQLFALKHVIRRQDKDLRFIEQLRKEWDITRQFTHPGLRKGIKVNIRRKLFRITEAALVLEFFDGNTLEKQASKSLAETVGIFQQTALALHALHVLGYVHCDLKPNNILTNTAGQVKVIDFGQAARIGSFKERIQGTPDFIAPEQVQRRQMTARTDIFNFGATLYWAISRHRIPTLYNVGKKDRHLLTDDQIAGPRTLDPSIPQNLSDLVKECIRMDPLKRPRDMMTLAKALEEIQTGLAKTV